MADVDALGTPIRTYTYGPGIDNLIAMTVHSSPTNQTFYAITDPLGTVHALVDETGTVMDRYTYDAWGNVQESGASQHAIDNRFLFQGREYSFATGLYNFRARWYNPQTGRWLSNDPIGISGGLNLYAFCGNNPMMYRDPDGEIFIYLHYFRNEFNTGLPKTIKDIDPNLWTELPPSKSVYHRQNAPWNRKFVSRDGHREAVYDKDGNL